MKNYLCSGFCALALGLMVSTACMAQRDTLSWDDASIAKWSAPFERVQITSSIDGSRQDAYMYRSTRQTPQPLIVSLHTWSGNFTQKDPLVKEILARDWNYIHPDFRGANRRPEAMGSPQALADIEDAIRYAVNQCGADPDEVHIVGVSGGGMATMAAYMNVDYPVKSFSAWCGISDIEAWYHESLARSVRYAQSIVASTSDDGHTMNAAVARQRSPLYQTFSKDKRAGARLYLYTGINDGYKGSVPTSHTLYMYNRVVGELKYGLADIAQIMQKAETDGDLVSYSEIVGVLAKQVSDTVRTQLFDRDIHLRRSYGPVELTVFEGRHEQIPQALGLLPINPQSTAKANVVVIGDGNAEGEGGWVSRLGRMMPYAHIVNCSAAGRTTGFDGDEGDDCNALSHVKAYLKDAAKQLDGRSCDCVVVALATNDARVAYRDRQDQVAEHLSQLLRTVAHSSLVGQSTRLVYICPPPVVETEDNKGAPAKTCVYA